MFSIGSDPEFMLIERDQDHFVYKSAIDVLPSRRHAIQQRGHLLFYENVVAECCIKPAKSKNEFIQNIRDGLKIITETVRPLKVTSQSACDFPELELRHPDAMEAACKDDLCAYSLLIKKAPKELIRDTCFRSAGGHIHLGSKMLLNGENIPAVVRMLDLFLSVPFVLIDRDESSMKRRRVYGQAGRHRITSYGLEYRTPSNYWLFSPRLAMLTYDLCDFVLNFVAQKMHSKFWTIDYDIMRHNPTQAHICYGYDTDALQQCINTCDKEYAQKFMMIIDSFLPDHLQHEIEIATRSNSLDLYQEWSF